MNYGWPQILVLVGCIVGFLLHAIIGAARVHERLVLERISFGRYLLARFVSLGYYVFYFYALHVGGFW